ncbi:MAG: hypothetical protein DMG35_20925 [Acidobacteria bacterium]|nr:MAG: hypothetical protein DMG35_20925 [Acidobacteriota bacterium]
MAVTSPRKHPDPRADYRKLRIRPWPTPILSISQKSSAIKTTSQADALRKNIQDTEAQRDKANEQLEKMIDDLQIEATM